MISKSSTSKKTIILISVLYLSFVASYLLLKYLLRTFFKADEFICNIVGYIYLYVIIMPVTFILLKNRKMVKKQCTSKSTIVFVFCQQTLFSIIFLNIGRVIKNIFFDTTYDLKLNVYNYIVLLLIAPIFEELFFRKMFFDLCCKLNCKNNYLILLCNGIIFAIPHIFSQGVEHFFYTLILGIVWCYTYIKYHNILYCIILHFCSNLLMILFNVLKIYYLNKAFLVVIFIVALVGLFTNKGIDFKSKDCSGILNL